MPGNDAICDLKHPGGVADQLYFPRWFGNIHRPGEEEGPRKLVEGFMETLPIGCVGGCQTFQQLLFSVFHCEGVIGMPQQDKQLAVHLMLLKMLLRMNIEGQACFFGDVPV